MKATLKLEDGREIAVDVSEEMLKQIEKPVKNTGYERLKYGDIYFYFGGYGVDSNLDSLDDSDDGIYDTANYYSDKTVAENNARADALMRKLRRFAVEHRETELDWNDDSQSKYYFYYNYSTKMFNIDEYLTYRDCGMIAFDSIKTAEAAIKEFKDELLWYFTEYKDSL